MDEKVRVVNGGCDRNEQNTANCRFPVRPPPAEVELNIAKLLIINDAQGAGELLKKAVNPAQMVEQLLHDLEPGVLRVWGGQSSRPAFLRGIPLFSSAPYSHPPRAKPVSEIQPSRTARSRGCAFCIHPKLRLGGRISKLNNSRQCKKN